MDREALMETVMVCVSCNGAGSVQADYGRAVSKCYACDGKGVLPIAQKLW